MRTRTLVAGVVVGVVVAGCSKPGTLTVTTKGTGPGLEGLALVVEVDSGKIANAIAATDGNFTKTDTPGGKHTVQLSGFPETCTVEGGVNRTVTISSGKPATVAYVLSCQ